MNTVVCLIAGLMGFVLWRWWWLRRERHRLSQFAVPCEERFDPNICDDEHDKLYKGRIIDRLRSRLVEGRIEIHWEFRPEFIHRGFVLTAKWRTNNGSWRPVPMEPFQDSGSWIECFNYGESRSYVFIVKKSYRFFFGLLGEAPDEIVYDQISFSVRKGKYLKEKKELIRDRRELLGEVKEYAKAEREIRQMMSEREQPPPEPSIDDPVIEKLEKRRTAQTGLSNYLQRETDKINARSDWDEERKSREIQRLHELAAEIALEE